jgi:hypothetical protein
MLESELEKARKLIEEFDAQLQYTRREGWGGHSEGLYSKRLSLVLN